MTWEYWAVTELLEICQEEDHLHPDRGSPPETEEGKMVDGE